MGQNKITEKQDKIVKTSNPSTKKHQGDTERTSDQGRKAASGGQTETNNQGQHKKR